MKTNTISFLTAFCTLLLFGCQSMDANPTEKEETTSVFSQESQSEKISEETATSSITQPLKESTDIPISSTEDSASTTPTTTPKSTATTTATAQLELQERCIEILPLLDANPTGELVLLDDSEIALVDFERDTQNRIVGKSSTYAVVSPSSYKIAFINQETKRLFVIDQNGEIIAVRSVPANWVRVIAWQSEAQLIIEEFLGATEIPLSASLLYDFKTEITKPLPSKWPDMYTFGAVPGWFHGSGTAAIFNRQLSYVVYLSEFPLVLFDLVENKEVTRIEGIEYWYANEPQWGKDGLNFVVSLAPYGIWESLTAENTPDHLAYKGGTDLFRVFIDGTRERLTYMSVTSSVTQDAAVVSPEENYIVFWRNEYPDISFGIPVTRTLTLVDLRNNTILDLCIENNTYITYGSDDKASILYAPVWSPDERYVAVLIQSPTTQGKQILIMDLWTFTGMYIPTQAIPTGWLRNQN